MYVRWLELHGFRNHASLTFGPDPGVNVLIGPNGHGKTSLLEAVHLLVTGRSFRTAHLAECVRWGTAETVVAGELVHGPQSWPIRLRVFARGGLTVEPGLCPWARAVSFAASDLALLTGPPQVRRAYLDGTTALLVPAQAEASRRYRLVLHHRARLLGQLRGRADGDRLLEPWDEQVAGLGSEIVHRRLETLQLLGEETREVWRALAPEGREMALQYVPAVEPGAARAATRDRLREALRGRRRLEVARGLTMVGPHRDELMIRLGGMEARGYASRGEQRVMALALRLAAAATVGRRVGHAPVLVLDDVLSELDRDARGRVLGWLESQGQVIFSSTDAGMLPGRSGVAWEVRPGGADAPVGDEEALAAKGAA